MNHKLQTALPISMAVLATLGTLLLGLGQQSVFLPVLAALAAVASVIFTDRLRKFRLNRNLANLAAVAAVIYSIIPFFDNTDSETHLLAIANLLIYLQIVLLFQHKNLRIYWQLSILSLLQVVVAAALNLSFSFGVLLIVYLFAALTALTLLFVYRETLHFSASDGSASDDAKSEGQPPHAGSSAGKATVWSTRPTINPAAAMLGGHIKRHIVAMGCATMAITVLVFFGVPRRNPEGLPGANIQSITGFSQEVSLGGMSEILQSNQLVMRVTFSDARTGRPFQPSGQPYFRGAVLSRYQPGRARWRGSQMSAPMEDLREAPPEADVIQDITIEPARSETIRDRERILFSTFPVFRTPQTPSGIVVDPDARQLMVDTSAGGSRQFRYALATGAFGGSMQNRLTAESSRYFSFGLLAWPVRETPQLAALADQIVAESGAPPEDRLARALALEAHFKQLAAYEYSLDPDVVRTPGMDPIEDFVVNHRTGHCEYFASALVLMLRSQGIPARMVVGYKGGDFNSVGSYFEVRQKHAHAWVEAHLEPGQYKVSQLYRQPDSPSGAWLRLDPTPGSEADVGDLGAVTLLTRLGDVLDYVQLLWNDYVLDLNSERQQESIYQPLAKRFAESVDSLRRGNLWSWLVWIAGLALLVVVGLSVAWGLRGYLVSSRENREKISWSLADLPPVRWLVALLSPGRKIQRHQHVIRVDFYERLERVLQSAAIRRQPNQTQREFATAAGGQLADQPQLQSVAGLPRRIVESYYRVRFGGRALDNDERLAVEKALRELESALANGRRHTRW